MSWLRISCLVDGVGAGFVVALGVADRGRVGSVFCFGGVGFVVAGGRRGGVGLRGDIGRLVICRLGPGPFAIAAPSACSLDNPGPAA